ncbi:MAG: sigma-54-dependent Fis family transcriptional regulator [Oceanicaulis sp.]|uniref:Sigma-54-dependent Fis family transcriptional regulator n=1 Tax=Maricaulis virginensis TaxID=144022 RepID=A0A9W6IL48_9PROT|nr:sigma-54 dependent transcriptional regulator [Maricaulis virginensis]MAC39267.1 sigma-54-dependent Fis family transcriptional regulator [Oceanicaulis sp.]MBI75048.1 sigma-54-dependent Fis family transcriptional regulator [Oceanicaulis sp.]GLK51279.1 sigma-54-dependent Fis family transcriptional regulator [Maricaulis virginensis]
MRILIVGSLGGQLHTATKIALDRGAKVSQVDTIEQATAHLRAGRGADLLMVDLSLDVQALIAANEAERISVPVVACGVNVRPEAAAAAIRAGAKEFIPMPPDADLIAAVLQAIADDERPMIARDPSMQAVIQLADRIAASDASVLITGESGSGKEVMARYVHSKSKRASAPFVSVNCAAIPENLLESELFGHEKGAFTGAIARRVGKFEEADGGTLLLDEISEMDIRLQAKLLRAIQEREIDRVGGTKPVKVNIRILATSNRDLRKAVAEGIFREDLLFRLNVVNLALPPLRERPADILALAEHFTKKYATANAIEERPISEAAKTQLLAREWTGNVRELENAMHRAVLLASGREITPDAIRMPDGSAFTGSGNSVARQAADAAQSVQTDMIGRTVAEVEQDLILNTLDHCLGNRTHAANILGISIRTLRNKLKLYSDQGLDIPAPNQPATGASVA